MTLNFYLVSTHKNVILNMRSHFLKKYHSNGLYLKLPFIVYFYFPEDGLPEKS